ncbi:MAG: hypothetical protein ACRDP5_02285, partial [Streptosporangiaceae bacterium]
TFRPARRDRNLPKTPARARPPGKGPSFHPPRLQRAAMHDLFNQVIAITGLLYAGFYILTALAAVTYYRRFIFSKFWDAIFVGILPLAGAAFLAWIIYKSLDGAPASEVWSVVGIVAAGVILMLIARFVLRSAFFQIPRETAPKETAPTQA